MLRAFALADLFTENLDDAARGILYVSLFLPSLSSNAPAPFELVFLLPYLHLADFALEFPTIHIA